MLMRLVCSCGLVVTLETLPIVIRISVLLDQSLTSRSLWVLSSLCKGPVSMCNPVRSLVPQCRNVREIPVYTACDLIVILAEAVCPAMTFKYSFSKSKPHHSRLSEVRA